MIYTSSKPVQKMLCDYLASFCHSCALRYNQIKLDSLYFYEAPLFFKACESLKACKIIESQDFHLYMDTISEDFLFTWKHYTIKAWFFTINETHVMLYQADNCASFEWFFILPKEHGDTIQEQEQEDLTLLLKFIEEQLHTKRLYS